ncbi:MAG: DUF4394 domain-containing protein [Pseudomonadota bacterium]
MFIRTTCAATSLLATAAFADGHVHPMGYALANDGMTLLTMEHLGKPSDIASFDLAEPVHAIAYRPVTGDLLGFSRAGKVFVIDASTGEMTDTGAAFDDGAEIGAGAVAFDFNNKIDAVRAVGSDGANLVYFPADFGGDKANTVKRFTDTFYAEGDANAGKTPSIFANAYTNAIAGAKASGTYQYALDAQTDALVSLANNAGELKTIGPITVDGTAVDLMGAGGFDIISPEEGTDMAYALLQMEGADVSGLYSIDLATGAATQMAELGVTGLMGFAVSMGGE